MKPHFPNSQHIRRTLEYSWAKTRFKGGECDVEGMSREEFFRFRFELIEESAREIQRGRYKPAPARSLTIQADKPRVAYRFRWIDHFWMDYLSLLIRDHAETFLSDSVVGFRPGRGLHTALAHLRRYIKASKGQDLFVLRRDIQNYGPSMSHQHLLDIFRALPSECAQHEALFRQFLRFDFQVGSGVDQNSSGLPAGSQLQTVFDNLYLHPLDQQLTPIPDAVYVRFGDDILFATIARDAAERASAQMSSYFSATGLAPHPEKCQDLVLTRQMEQSRGAPLYQPIQVFGYLGMQVDIHGDARLSREKLRKVTSFIRSQLQIVLNGASGVDESSLLAQGIQTIRNIFTGVASDEGNALRHYLPLIHDDQQLRELDRWIALSVLGSVYRRGFKQSNFKRVSFKQLRQRGLPSLVHVRRKGVVV